MQSGRGDGVPAEGNTRGPDVQRGEGHGQAFERWLRDVRRGVKDLDTDRLSRLAYVDHAVGIDHVDGVSDRIVTQAHICGRSFGIELNHHCDNGS